MSLILDALRKMEQERRSRQGAALDIRPEVLRYRAVLKPRQARPYLLTGAAALLVAVGLGAGAFLKGKATAPQLPPAPAAATLAAPAPPTLATEAPAASAPLGPAPPATEPAPPVTMQPPTAAASATVGGPVEPSPQVQVERSSRTLQRRGALTAAPVEEPPARVRPRAPQPEPAGAVQAAPQDISVSGIAYQDERSLRRAVVNGTLVGEGAEVGGGRVVEIRENKVRMSRGGQLFDVVLSSGLPGR